MCYYSRMALYLALCFAVPAICALYAALARRELARHIPMFIAAAALSVVAASAAQALTQPFFSEAVIFSGGTPALVLHSFVQAGLIEEGFKAIFFFLALRRAFSAVGESRDVSESAAFFFAVFSGSLFASLETLAGVFYLPGSAVTRMFTAHVLHPAALLVSASGAFFGKKRPIGYFLPCAAAVAAHGFYNFTAGFGNLSWVVLYTAGALVLTAALWALIFSMAYSSAGKGHIAKGEDAI